MSDSLRLRGGILPTSRLALCGRILIFVYVALLALLFANGTWVRGSVDGVRATDFLVFWSAGKLALQHAAAAAYDWPALEAVERELLGAPPPALPLVYPPTFLLAIAPFALIPYVPAFFLWLGTTLAAYLAAIHAIIRHRLTPVLALASPPVLWNAFPGQNGYLTAALLGGTLVFLDERPILSGVLLGLLAYKPQFGVLFPIVLAITGRWRVFMAAALTAAAFLAASYLAFGEAAWNGFIVSAPAAIESMSGTAVPWAKLQSIYGLVRWLGGDHGLATVAFAAVALAASAMACAVWLRRVDYALKAAALSAATLLATPRLFVYDMTAIAVPVAFLLRACLTSGFRRGERETLVAIFGMLLLLCWGWLPVGALLIAALLALVLARVKASIQVSTEAA